MTRWLVTGASGFLGANVPARLPVGDVAIAATRDGRRLPGFHEAVRLDLLDDAALRAAIESARPDVVLHAAALSSHAACEADPGLAHRVNAEATALVAAASHGAGARLVYVSTDAVFGGDNAPYAEDDAPMPFSAYGRSKLAGELAADVTPGALIARVNFYGWSPTGSRSILEFFASALRSGTTAPGFTDYVVSSAYVADTIDAMVTCVVGERSGLVHIAAPEGASKAALGIEVARALGLDGALIEPTTRPDGPLDLTLDVSRLQEWAGWVPRPLAGGIAAAIADESRLRALFAGR